MKRSILSLCIIFALTASLFAGCQSSDNPPNSQDNGTDEIIDVVFWHSMTDEAGLRVEQYVQEFNDGPGGELGIRAEAVFQGVYADSTTKMRTILQNDQPGQLPDLMQIDATGMVDYKSTGYAFTVDDALALDGSYDLSQILDAPLEVWRYDGRQLGMPFSASTMVTYYNIDLLSQAGYTGTPSTFAEIVGLAATLPETNDAGQPVYAYAAIPNTLTLANWIGQIPGEGGASYVVENRNGRDGDADRLVCDGEGTLLHFLTAWKEMYDTGALLNQSDGTADLFYTGQLALYTASTSQLNTILATVGDRFPVGCAYYPRIDDNSQYGATISGSGLFLFDKGDTGRAMAAWELMKYLTSAEVQADYSTSTGYFPVNRGAYDTDTYRDFVAEYPHMAVSVEQVEQTSPNLMGVTIGPSYDFYMEVQNQVSDMLTSGRSAAESVEMMANALNGLLEQYAQANR